MNLSFNFVENALAKIYKLQTDLLKERWWRRGWPWCSGLKNFQDQSLRQTQLLVSHGEEASASVDRRWCSNGVPLPLVATRRSSMTMDRHIDRSRRRSVLNIRYVMRGRVNRRDPKILPHFFRPLCGGRQLVVSRNCTYFLITH